MVVDLYTYREGSLSRVQGTGIINLSPVVVDPPEAPDPGTEIPLRGHTSPAELDEWNSRITAGGPFVVQETVGDDVFPGDWNGIVSSKNKINNDISLARWGGPTGNNPGGHVVHDRSTQNNNSPQFDEPSHFRNACYWVMVQYGASGASNLAQRLANEIHAQSKVSGVDFTDRTRFCLEGKHILGDNPPLWRISTWGAKLAFSYTYLRNYEILTDTSLFTNTQRNRIHSWFDGLMVWLWHSFKNKLDGAFSDWLTASENGPWNVTADDVRNGYVAYDGAPTMLGVQVKLSNRLARTLRTVGVIAELRENLTMRANVRRGVKAYLMYWYSGSGWCGDFERGKASVPWKGLKYTQEAYGSLAIIADLQARAGDSSLLTWTTTVSSSVIVGTHLPSDGPRSLWTLAWDLVAYDNGDYIRQKGGVRIRTDSNRIDDVNLLMLNHYARINNLYAANRVYNTFMRQLASTYSRPANPSTGQDIPPDNGVLPEQAMFMFADLPITINPWG